MGFKSVATALFTRSDNLLLLEGATNIDVHQPENP